MRFYCDRGLEIYFTKVDDRRIGNSGVSFDLWHATCTRKGVVCTWTWSLESLLHFDVTQERQCIPFETRPRVAFSKNTKRFHQTRPGRQWKAKKKKK